MPLGQMDKDPVNPLVLLGNLGSSLEAASVNYGAKLPEAQFPCKAKSWRWGSCQPLQTQLQMLSALDKIIQSREWIHPETNGLLRKVGPIYDSDDVEMLVLATWVTIQKISSQKKFVNIGHSAMGMAMCQTLVLGWIVSPNSPFLPRTSESDFIWTQSVGRY